MGTGDEGWRWDGDSEVGMGMEVGGTGGRWGGDGDGESEVGREDLTVSRVTVSASPRSTHTDELTHASSSSQIVHR